MREENGNREVVVFTKVIPMVPGIEPVSAIVMVHVIEPVKEGSERKTGEVQDLKSPESA